ncbi:hypothetical protein H8356DRAFT_1350377 [Neocallimastix lanati (nom. inval.)]|nr:hypothetical protein H8356DRAFT_1350377 [Neocallimastix sp. JGI-2020a]
MATCNVFFKGLIGRVLALHARSLGFDPRYLQLSFVKESIHPHLKTQYLQISTIINLIPVFFFQNGSLLNENEKNDSRGISQIFTLSETFFKEHSNSFEIDESKNTLVVSKHTGISMKWRLTYTDFNNFLIKNYNKGNNHNQLYIIIKKQWGLKQTNLSGRYLGFGGTLFLLIFWESPLFSSIHGHSSSHYAKISFSKILDSLHPVRNPIYFKICALSLRSKTNFF